jgi:hypothetical protein
VTEQVTEYVYEYALVRVVPRVERGEQLNAGVLVYSRQAGLVRAVIHLDEARLLALDPGADVPAVRNALAAVAAVCTGGAAASSSPVRSTAGSAPTRRPRPTGCWTCWCADRAGALTAAPADRSDLDC